MANLIEIVVTATDETAPGFESARAGADSLGQSAEGAGSKLESLGASGEQAAAEVQSVGGSAENTGASVERLGTSAEQGAAGVEQAAASVEQLGATAAPTAAKVEQVAGAAEQVGGAAAAGAGGMESLAASTQRVGTTSEYTQNFMRRIAEETAKSEEAARAGAMSFEEFSRRIGETGSEVKTAATEAEKLGAGVEKVGVVARVAGSDLGQAAQGLNNWVNGLMLAHPIITALIALLPMLGGLILMVGAGLETLAFGGIAVVLGFKGIEAAVSQLLPGLHFLEAAMSGVFQNDLSKPFTELGHVLVALTPQFKDLADAVAGIIQQFIPTRQAVEQLGGVLESVAGFFREGAKGASDLATAVATMAEAAAPEMKDFADGINHIYEAWKTAVQELSKTGELQAAFAAMAGGVKAFGDTLSAVMTVLVQVTAVAGPQLNDIVSQMSDALKAWGPAIANFVKGIDDLFNGLGPLLTILGKFVSLISPIFDVIGNGLGVILGLVGGLKLLALAWRAVSAIMLADPIVLVLAALVLLIGAIVTLIQNTKDFGDTWDSVWGAIGDGIKSVFDAIMVPIKALEDALKWIMDAISSISQSLGGSSVGSFSTELGQIPGHATGGIGSGVSIVGENGPELVNLPGGSTISSNSDLSAMMTGGGSSGGGGDQFSMLVTPGSDSYVGTMINGLIRAGKIQIRRSQLV